MMLDESAIVRLLKALAHWSGIILVSNH